MTAAVVVAVVCVLERRGGAEDAAEADVDVAVEEEEEEEEEGNRSFCACCWRGIGVPVTTAVVLWPALDEDAQDAEEATALGAV